jgi:7-cyano-7-deazaguanine synthase
MIASKPQEPIGVLISGGLDSSILLAELIRLGHLVQPIYIRSQLRWEQREFRGLQQYLTAISTPRLAKLVKLELPVRDLYHDHWSVTGIDVPGRESRDDAVYLPGRNTLLIVKARLWCQLNGIAVLALAPLGSSPFADASKAFIESFANALNLSDRSSVQIEIPFSGMTKEEVMQLGAHLPLELTFSCIAPQDDMHCGQCNKCAERQRAFRGIGRKDQTRYASVCASI